MAKNKNNTWMIIAIIFIITTFLFFLNWLFPPTNEELNQCYANNQILENTISELERSGMFWMSAFNHLGTCYEEGLDECNFDYIKSQYGYGENVSNYYNPFA